MSKSPKSYDIKMSVKKYEPMKDYNSSNLHLEITGKDVHPKMINTISRVSATHLPTYSLHPQTINILENTSLAYDNQYMQLRLSNLPLYNIDLDLYHLHDKYWQNINYTDINREKHPLEKDIKFYINITNKTQEIMSATTNDLEVFIDNTRVEMYNKKYPILLIKLRPNDTFKCNMSAVLGIGEANAIWRASVNSYAPYDDDKYNLFLRSNGQETEFVILIKSIKHIIKRLEDIKKEINSKTEKHKETENFQLVLDGEDHTMGEVINYELQNHSNLHCGMSKPDLLIKSVIFKIYAKEPNKLFKSINETLDDLTDKYKYILKLAENINKK